MMPHVAGKSVLSQATGGTVSPACQLRIEVVPGDRHAVRTLVECTGFFNRDEIEIAVELVNERLAHGPASGYEFVFADVDALLAGYACYGAIPCTSGSFDLYWIAVDPRFQRQGIGAMLMADVESRIAAAGGERIYIDTSGRGQYEPTRAFYERNGFRCEARLKDFYAPGDDRVIYVKALAKRA
jgi:ribosomal protein S18 acetylase RimI-like enzyme